MGDGVFSKIGLGELEECGRRAKPVLLQVDKCPGELDQSLVKIAVHSMPIRKPKVFENVMLLIIFLLVEQYKISGVTWIHTGTGKLRCEFRHALVLFTHQSRVRVSNQKTNNLKIPVARRSVTLKGNFVMKSKLLTVVCLVALGLGNMNTCRASEDNSLDVVADVAIVRPGCFLATVLGSVVFVVALPITVTSKSFRSTADTLVVHPAAATFTRPVGDFSSLH